MARPVFRPIIFALKRAPTWPGAIIPYEPPELTWVLENGIWRNVGYWFADRTSWNNGNYVESEELIYDGMPEDQVIGTIKYVIDLFDNTGAANISSPQAATVKLNQIAYQLGLLTRITDIMAGSDAIDIINDLLSTLTGGGWAQILRSLLRWDTQRFPLKFTKSGGVWSSDFDRNDYMPDSDCQKWYYVNVDTGSDSANGDAGTPVKSVWKAIDLGNASAFSNYGVIVTASGTVPRANWFNNSGSTKPNKKIWVKSASGAVRGGQFDNLSWADDGSGANTYVATRTNVRRIVDPGLLNSYNNYTDFIKVADAAAVRASAGNTWAQVGSLIYAKKPSGPVTNANTRAYLAVNHFLPTASFYLENIHFEGGGNPGPGTLSGGLLFINDVLDGVGIAQSCSFKYGGDDTTFLNNIDIRNSSGLFAFNDCDFGSAAKDGGGIHWYNGGEPPAFVLTEKCRGRDFGRGASTSNNPITGHENLPWIDVEGDYGEGRGGVAFVDDSRLLMLGSDVADDLGDGLNGTKGVVRTADTARAYLVDGSVSSSVSGITALRADGSSSIRYQNTTLAGGTTGDVTETRLVAA